MTAARRELLHFGLRFGFLFAISWMPIPWLADIYSTAFAKAANGPLAIVSLGSGTRFHMRGPERIRVAGSWKPTLEIEQPGQPAQSRPINVKVCSFRPLAMFLALALASRLEGRRRGRVVIGGGLAVILALTSAITALPPLTEFAVRGQLGRVFGFIVETAYVVLVTPLMVYLLPLLVWWLLMWRTRAQEDVEKSAEQAARPAAAGL